GEQTRREADAHAKQHVASARKNAEQILAEAKAEAERLLVETKAEAERHRSIAQRQVDELTRQKDSITGHLTQLRQLLGGMPVTGGPFRVVAASFAGLDVIEGGATCLRAMGGHPGDQGTSCHGLHRAQTADRDQPEPLLLGRKPPETPPSSASERLIDQIA